MTDKKNTHTKSHQAKVVYVTGTDTDVGKTIISSALLKAYNKFGFSTVAMKPIASGCHKKEGRLLNQDALLLQKNASTQLDYETVNPIALEPAIAPHIAAQEIDFALSSSLLVKHAQTIVNQEVDLALIEGAGGWYVPINATETLADFAKAINASVILVVSIRLGCINHALLTVNAIEQQGLELVGWVANLSDTSEIVAHSDQEVRQLESRIQNNIDTLQARITAPLLAVTPWVKSNDDQEKINAIAECFNEEHLKNIINSQSEN